MKEKPKKKKAGSGKTHVFVHAPVFTVMFCIFLFPASWLDLFIL